jgi:hypothetical protein
MYLRIYGIPLLDCLLQLVDSLVGLMNPAFGSARIDESEERKDDKCQNAVFS